MTDRSIKMIFKYGFIYFQFLLLIADTKVPRFFFKYGFLYLPSKTMRTMLFVCKPSASKMFKSGLKFFFKILYGMVISNSVCMCVCVCMFVCVSVCVVG